MKIGLVCPYNMFERTGGVQQQVLMLLGDGHRTVPVAEGVRVPAHVGHQQPGLGHGGHQVVAFVGRRVREDERRLLAD